MLNYDAYANMYDSRYTSRMCLQENIAIYEAIRAIPNLADRKIVDLGCGTGFFLDICQVQFDQSSYLGIDVSEEMIRYAYQKYPKARFVIEDSREMEKIVQKFNFHPDLALSLFTIPYIGRETIESCYKILPKDGLFLMVYYNKPFLNPASVYADKVKHYEDDVHPKVIECVACAKRLFETEYEHTLTDIPAYDIALYRKVK